VNAGTSTMAAALPRLRHLPMSPSTRIRVVKALVRRIARRVPVDIMLPDGELLDSTRNTAGARPGIVLHRPEVFYRRLADQPKIGIGEAYTAGDWGVAAETDLADALIPFAARVPTLLPGWLLRLRGLVDQSIPSDQRGAREHTRGNIASHYDLSNEMFAAFLDSTLTYSSALFDPTRPRGEQTLEAAQLHKVQVILDLADVGPGTRLLEIGTGWGTLAIEAARRGAIVTTVTLSIEQAELARQRIRTAGLSDRVDVLVQDYRCVDGSYDAVVSVEMIEAVGERYWPEYFTVLARLVRPGGAIALQSILMSHQRYLATRRSYGWIQKHIFPGGLIPSLTAIEHHASSAGLRVGQVNRFGLDYAETLRRWRSAFTQAWPRIRSERFDESFRRTWEFYLAYCEAGFRAHYLDVAQLRLEATVPEAT